MCRSRRELSNEYLLAKFGFDTAENEPLKVRITDHTFDHIPSVLWQVGNVRDQGKLNNVLLGCGFVSLSDLGVFLPLIVSAERVLRQKSGVKKKGYSCQQH